MADIFDSYTTADAWDEMFERPGVLRPAYEMAQAFTDRGVTYSYGGEERPFPA